MRLMTLLLLTVLMPSAVFGQLPKAVITGPTEAMPGDFIDLTSEGSVGDFFDWEIDPPAFKDGRKSFRFPRLADGTLPAPQKSRECQIASRPMKYAITLTVSNDEGIAKAKWIVTVFEGIPTAPTNPTTPITPITPTTPTQPPAQPPAQPPIDPDPIPGLTAWVRDTATAKVPAGPTRRNIAQTLSNAYKQTLEKVAPLINDPIMFAKAQDITNKGVLMILDSGGDWSDFMSTLAQKLADANLTRAQQDKVWKNISDGLGAVQ